MYKIHFLFMVLCLLTCSGKAEIKKTIMVKQNNTQTMNEEELNIEEIAITYYKAITSGNFDKVREVASPDLIFEDPTAPHGLVPAKIEGIESVIAYYEKNAPKLKDRETNIVKSFVSNNRVVLYQDLKAKTDISEFGLKAGVIEFKLSGIAVVHIVDGLVVHYIDYLDYTDIMSKAMMDK